MVSVTIQGGLGNQLFQFATGRNLARRLKTDLHLELSFYEHREARDDFTPRTFLLEQLGIPTRRLSSAEWERRRAAPDIHAERHVLSRCWDAITGKPRKFIETIPTFDSELFAMRGDVHLEGYFQDYRYLEDAGDFIKQCIRESGQDQKTESHEIQHGAVCLHIRRGDYLSRTDVQALMGHCHVDYYENALEWLRREGINGPVYVFSDDQQYARNAFSTLPDVKIIYAPSHEDPTLHDFLLMMKCTHFIISNSSYSYWAAWLAAGKDSVVCYPSPWYKQQTWQSFSPAPPHWKPFRRF